MSGSTTVFFRGENPLKADKLNLAFSERVMLTGDVMHGPLYAFRDPLDPMEVVTKRWVDNTLSGFDPGGVISFNAREGNVVLTSADVTTALTYTPYDAANPAGYITLAEATAIPSVQSFNTRTGAVVLTSTDVSNAIGLLRTGGTMTGLLTLSADPTANLHAVTKQYVDVNTVNDTRIGTDVSYDLNTITGTGAGPYTSYIGTHSIVNQVAGLNFPAGVNNAFILTGYAANAGWHTQLFMGLSQGLGVNGVPHLYYRASHTQGTYSNWGRIFTSLGGTITGAATFSGGLTTTTLSASGAVSGTGFTTLLAPYALLASPAFTGNPTAPTPTLGDNDTTIATTAFVQAAMGSVPGGAIITDTPPASNPGALWWDSTGGNLFVRYNDGNSTQWVTAVNIPAPSNMATKTEVASAQNNVGRNLVHNGQMAVAQRGAGPFTASSTYTLDRWLSVAINDTISFTQTTLSDADRAAIGDEAATAALQNVFAGSGTAGSVNVISQRMEDVRRLSGKTVVISFWAKAATGTPFVAIRLDQNFGSGGSAGVSGSWATQAISTTWTRYSVTRTLPSATGKTVGGGNFTVLNIGYSVQGVMPPQSGTINLWGVQLEIAQPGQTQPTPLEKLDPQMELANCQRYYCNGYAQLTTYQGAASSIASVTYLPVTMRATPTVTTGGVSLINVPSVTSTPGTQYILFSAIATAQGPTGFGLSYTASADL